MSRHETFRAAGDGRAHLPAGVSAHPAGILPRPGLTGAGAVATGAATAAAAASAARRRAALWSPSAYDRRRVLLWSELVVLFVGIPLLMAAYFDELMKWGALGAFSLFVILGVLGVVAAVLLAITPGFSFRRLVSGPVLREWRLILGCTALAAVVCAVAVSVLLPERFFDLPFQRTPLWIGILAAYPFLSALPQELIYRVLFFERYGSLFPGSAAAITANAAAFGFGHLFYMHSITIAMTAVGGALIGWAYIARGRSVLLTWVLHTIAGWLIFTSGLGVYFFSGNVG